MGNLNEIADRHGRDRWMDAVFIIAAVVLTAVSIGSVTSKAAGKPASKHYELTVVESNLEIGR